jgi:hypothetical protein
MRKTFLLAAVLMAATAVYPQTEKGKMLVGGQANFFGSTNSILSSFNDYERNTIGFQLNPGFGYFISNNLAIGLNTDFGFTKSDIIRKYPGQIPSESTEETKTSGYGGGGFARYYQSISNNFFFFVNGGISYTKKTERIELANNDPAYIYPVENPASQEIHSNTYYLDISPGLVYFATPKLGIQSTFSRVYYRNSSSENKSLPSDNHRNTSHFGLEFNPTTFFIGLFWYL